MWERLGLGVDLELDDNMTRTINPLIRELERLRRETQNTANSVQGSNNAMYSSYRRTFNAQMLRDFNTAMRDTGQTALFASDRLLRATQSANMFANSVNRIQSAGNFNRMYNEIYRTQRVLGMMGYGMSSMQERMSNSRAYNMLNYQMKDLQDRIKLTSQAIRQMQNSPDASKFQREIALAQRSLQAYQNQLAQVNMRQQLAQTHGMRLMSLGGRDTLVNEASTLRQRIQYRLLGQSMMDVAHASNFVYKSIDKTAKMMAGSGYTTMELRQKITQLAGALTMTGMVMSQFATVPLAIATGAMGIFASKFEEAQNLFQARTLSTNVQMDTNGGWDDELGKVWANSGAEYSKVAKVMSDLKIDFPKRSVDDIGALTEVGLRFEKVWGADAYASITSADTMMKKFGVTSDQSFDILSLALKQTHGDLEKAEEYIQNNIGRLREMTSEGGKSADAFERMSDAMERGGIFRFMRGLREMGEMFRTLWESGIGEFVGKLGDELYRLGNGLNNLLEANPKLAKFIGYGIAIAGTFFMLLGPIALVTGTFIRFRNVIQGVGASIFGLSKGGLSVLSPQALMAKDRMDALTTAFARFPQTLFSIIPLFYSFVRMIPQFLANVLRMNPILGLVALGFVAFQKNLYGFRDTVMDLWDRLKDFFKGFKTGFGEALEVGKKFGSQVLDKFKQHFKDIEPYITKFSDKVSKLFGGDTTANWEKMGEIVGKVVAGFLAFKTLQFIATPFIEAGKHVGGLLAKLKLLPRSRTVRVNYVQTSSGTPPMGVGGAGSTNGQTRSGSPVVPYMPMGMGLNSREGRRNARTQARQSRNPIRRLGNFFSGQVGDFRDGANGNRNARTRSNQTFANRLGGRVNQMRGGAGTGRGSGGQGGGNTSSTRAGRNAGRGFRGGFFKAFNFVSGFTGLFKDIGKTTLKQGGKVGKGLLGGLGKVVTKGVPMLFKGALRAIPILGWAIMAWDIISLIFSNWDSIVAGAKKAWNWIKDDGIKYLGMAWDWIQKKAGDVWNWIKTDGWNMVKSLFSYLWDKAVETYNNVKSWAVQKFEEIKADAKQKFFEMFAYLLETAIQKAIEVKDNMLSKLQEMKDGAIEKFSGFFQPLLDSYNFVKDTIANNPIVQTVKKVTTTVASGAKKAGNAVANFVKGGLDGDPSTPYARGGFINRPHKGLVGEAGPEVIIPLSGNMRDRAKGLFKRTAGILGFNVAQNGSDSTRSPQEAMNSMMGGSFSTYESKDYDNYDNNNPIDGVDSGSNNPWDLGGGNNTPNPQPQSPESNPNSSTPTSQDNSITIQKLEIHFPKEMAGVGEQSARKQATLLMKELQKLMKEERMRQGNTRLTLEDMILGN
jgi:hypothetical protein